MQEATIGTSLIFDASNNDVTTISIKPANRPDDEYHTIIKTSMHPDSIKSAWVDIVGEYGRNIGKWAESHDICEVTDKLRTTYLRSLVKYVDDSRRHCCDDMVVAPITLMLEVGAWFSENGEWCYERIEEFIGESVSEAFRNNTYEAWKILVDYTGAGTMFIDMSDVMFRVQPYPRFINRVGYFG